MRYLILVCAVMMPVCMGATYPWGAYVQPLKALTGLAQGPVEIPFTGFHFSQNRPNIPVEKAFMP